MKIDEKKSFRDLLIEAVNEGKTTTFRADPIITSTDSGIIEKQVFPNIDILTSPAEAFLKQLGVTFYTGLTGNFVLPSMAEDTATFVTEAISDASSASMATASLTLTPRRVSHTQAISKETLSQTSPGIYAGIVQNLNNGLWNAVANDVFDQLRVDCGSTNESSLSVYPTWTNFVDMEASMGGKILNNPAYVVTPSMRAYLETTAKMTNQGPIFENGKINSYPAYGVPCQNSTVITFGDWSSAAVGQWGPIEIVVDPYTDAKKGLLNLTIVGLFDSGIVNKRRFKSYLDASIA